MSIESKAAEAVTIADLDTTPQRVRGSRGNFGDLVVGCVYELRPLSHHSGTPTLKIYAGRKDNYLYFTKPCSGSSKRLYRMKLGKLGSHRLAFPIA